VQVIYTRTTVRIFHRNERIATRDRVTGFGYSTVEEHLCSAHRHYNKRSPDYYIEAAKKKSATLTEIITLIFSRSKPPELFYRTCDGLLSLCRKTDPDRFEQACRIALEYNMVSYGYIKSPVEGKSLFMEQEAYKPLPAPQAGIRGKQYYK
jgi:hypothetical protein